MFGDYVSDTTNNFVSFFATKYDTNLNEEWTQKWSMFGYNDFRFAQILSDSTLIVSGAKYNSNGLVLRADSEGNILWTKEYPSYFQMYTFEYGDSLMSSSFHDENNSFWPVLVTQKKSDGTIVKTDTIKSQWSKSFPVYISFNSDKILLSGVEGSGWSAAWFGAMDYSGNLFWERRYWWDTSGVFHQFKMTIPTFDGGFLTGGSTIGSSGNQDIWLVKVDSLGCMSPNCNLGLEETNRALEWSIHPNPATSTVHVSLDWSVTNDRAELWSMTGQRINFHSFKGNKMELDLSFLPSGTYVLLLREEGDIVGRKIIVRE